jgi:dolichyl-phosphate-mannose--protein O-mannosyl transferase
VTILQSTAPTASKRRHAIVALVLFLAAYVAMLAGVTTPDHLYFDEVHYVPAARQMLEPVMSTPMLNPMHPPLAKQLIAVSICIFGDDLLAGVLRQCCRSAQLPSERRCRHSPG